MKLILVCCAVLMIVRFSMAADVTSKPAKVELGFESSPAVRLLSAQDRAAIANTPIQDLFDRDAGAYSLTKHDDVNDHWGLDAVAARRSATTKPYAALRDESGAYQCERIIFADSTTGAMMMQLTNEPAGKGGDELLYFGKSCWNLDGSRIVWQRSSKPSLWGPGSQKTTDTHGPLLANADGTSPRIAFRDRPSVQAPICSPTDPNLAYAMSGKDLVELDLRAGTVRRVVKSPLDCWWLKMSPDGKYVCGKGFSVNSLWVVSLADGQQWNIPLTKTIHDSYRFVPGDTDWIMFWYEGGGLKNEGIRMANFKTGEQKVAKVYFDWNHGDVGRFLGFHVTGTVTPWDGKTWLDNQHLYWPDEKFDDSGPYYNIPLGTNGYAQHWPDDRLWACAVVNTHEPAYMSDVSMVFAKPLPGGGRVNRFRVCLANLWRGNKVGGEPILLSRPNISPDGTKLLFNSNPFGDSTVYMVQLANPLPPVKVSAAAAPDGVKIAWEAPRYHHEIKGYNVYRSDESGRGFELITPQPVAATSYVDPAGAPAKGSARFYAMRSVENSGFESSLSAEAAVGVSESQPLRIFCQADAAIGAELDSPSPDSLWVNYDGTAGDLHYIWQRRKDKGGQVSLAVDVPRAGKYFIVARVKSKDGAEFQIAGQAIAAAANADWTWARSAQPIELAAGRQNIAIASSKYGSCLDCFYLAGDKDFAPAGRIVADAPSALKLTASVSPDGLAKLAWTGEQSPRWRYCNLYCSDQAGFTPDRRTLIASPDRGSFIDWQAAPGRHYYKVTQVTLDGLESPPSNEQAVTVGK